MYNMTATKEQAKLQGKVHKYNVGHLFERIAMDLAGHFWCCEGVITFLWWPITSANGEKHLQY